jgi:outer membrane protein OmpA-like peptidoglycan-associated protein
VSAVRERRGARFAVCTAPLLLAFVLTQAIDAAGAAEPAGTAEAAGTVKRFISCPIYRDTDNLRKSGCWIAPELETGRRYDVWNAINRPMLGQELLVEGAVSGEKDACGATVLNPVRISVLPSACAAKIVPAEGFPSRRYVTTGTVMTPKYLPQSLPQPPFRSKSYTIFFDFGDDLLMYQHAETMLIDAARLAIAGKARNIKVSGHALQSGFVASGRPMQEPTLLAEARAHMVSEALRRLGVPAILINETWSIDPPASTDVPAAFKDSSRRRVSVEVLIDP